MGLINVNTPQDGDTANASSVANPLNTIVSEFNGNIESVNLANNAVTNSKLANNSVSTANLQDESVTQDKLADRHYAVTHQFPSGTGSRTITGFNFVPKIVIVQSARNTGSSDIIGHGYAYNTGSGIVQGATCISGDDTEVSLEDAFLIQFEGSDRFRAEVTDMNTTGELSVNVKHETDGNTYGQHHIIILG